MLFGGNVLKGGLFGVLFLLVGAGGVLAVGGETYLTAVEIPYLPYSDTGNTSTMTNDGGMTVRPDAWYKIVIPAEVSTTLDMCLSAPSSGGWDTYLSIFASNGTSMLFEDDDEYVSCGSGECPGTWGGSAYQYQSKIDACELTEGTYYICVEGYAGGSYSGMGSYCLNITDNCLCSSAQVLTCSSGTVSGNNDINWPGSNCWAQYWGCYNWEETGPESMYYFENTSGVDQAIRLILTPEATHDLDLILLSGCTNTSTLCGDNELFLFWPDEFGANLVVDGYALDVANYTLGIECQTFCEADGIPIHCGQTYPDQTTLITDRPSYWDTYDSCFGWEPDGTELVYPFEFDGTGGQFTVSIDNYTTDLVLVVLDSCDNETGCVDYADTYLSDDTVTVNPASAGTYFFVVDSMAGDEGPFDIYVQCSGNTLNCAGATSISCGSTVSGTTSSGMDNVSYYDCVPYEQTGPERVYSFTLASSQNVTINMEPTDGQDLDLFLLNACNSQACRAASSTTGNESIYEAALPAGTYYIVVDGYRDAVGTYNLTVYCGNTPTPTRTPTPTGTVTPTPTSTPEQTINCATPVNLACEEYYIGSTLYGENRAVQYNCAPTIEELGKELIYPIIVTVPYTFQATMSPALGMGVNLDLFLLSSCDQDACIASSTNSSPLDAVETITYAMSVGTYYLVVDGLRDGDFTLVYNCPPPTLDCTSPVVLTCGATYNGTTVGEPLNVTQYSCNVSLDESGPENVHQIYATVGNLAITLTPATGVDLDFFLLSDCDQDHCLAYSASSQGGVESLNYTVSSATTYFIVVDGYRGAVGTYSLLATCGLASPTPTRTPTRTATPTIAPPTNTPTRTPTSPAATNTPTRTPTSPAATNTPTRTPTSSGATPTPTGTLQPLPAAGMMGNGAILMMISLFILFALNTNAKRR